MSRAKWRYGHVDLRRTVSAKKVLNRSFVPLILRCTLMAIQLHATGERSAVMSTGYSTSPAFDALRTSDEAAHIGVVASTHSHQATANTRRFNLTRMELPDEILRARAKRKSARRGPTRKRSKEVRGTKNSTRCMHHTCSRHHLIRRTHARTDSVFSYGVLMQAPAELHPIFHHFGFDSHTPVRVLLVGEMDFSFAMDCSNFRRPGLLHLTATTYFGMDSIPKRIRGLFRNSARVLRKRGVDVRC